MLETITNHIRSAAKAYVAAATPIIATAVADLVTELNSVVAGLITVALTGLAVYLVPNRDA